MLIPSRAQKAADLFRFWLPFWLLTLTAGGTVWGQESRLLDSLRTLLATEKKDTSKVNLMNEIAWELKVDEPDAARATLRESLELAEEARFLTGKGNAYNYLGVVEIIHGYPQKAIQYFEQALTIRDSLGDTPGMASLYNNIGNLRGEQGDYIYALDNYLKALRIAEQLRDSSRIINLYYNISDLHESMGNYPEALDYIFQYLAAVELTDDSSSMANAYNIIGNVKYELERLEEASDYYQRALELHRRLGNDWEVASVLNNIGNAKDEFAERMADEDQPAKALQLSSEALSYYQQALKFREKLQDQDGIAEVFNNMGIAYKYQGSYLKSLGKQGEALESWQTALSYFDQALKLWEEKGDKKGIIQVYNGMGDVARRQGDYPRALDYTKRYLALAEEIQDQKYIQNAFKDLSRVYSVAGNYKDAFEYRKKYDELRYDRINEKRIKDNERREILYSDRKKQYEIERQRQELLLQEAELRQARIRTYSLIGGTIGLILLAVLLYNRNKIKTRANRKLAEKNEIIAQEQERSERLLLNILPAATAEELKKHGKAKAKQYDSVTVLFSDFKSFTTIAEQMSAEDLVSELDECFRAFDEITARYEIEKIKTIGDAYMCAGGLPDKTPDHAERVVQAALEMLDFMDQHAAERRTQGQPVFEMRIGIHTGPVVAGIVGSRKFAYDIWGDTVNLAARMESSGAAGKINISEETYQLVKGQFNCLARGKVTAKNKGEQEMYFVSRAPRKAEPAKQS